MRKSKKAKNGFHSWCKECFNKYSRERYNKDLNSKKCKQWKAKHPDYQKNYDCKRNYGISIYEKNILRKNQNYKCLCCNLSEFELGYELVVDLCHETLKIRGLLCNGCNQSLGLVKENITILKNLLNYLIKNKGEIHG